MGNLFQTATDDFETRAIVPVRELGAYEALWALEGMTSAKLAALFRDRPGSLPSDFVSEADAQKFARLALGQIKEAGIQRFGIRVAGAGEYPVKLRDAANPAELLYYRGDWGLVNSPCVALVGTRDPSEEGQRRARKLAHILVRKGVTVVSGLARGIDTVAHRAALEAGGRTIAVIGTPITTAYPAENRALQEQLADEFLVISQVPMIRYSRQSVKFNRLFFPERNITMAALTQATIIVEASNTSGTLIQARHALKQGRKLFILESCFQRDDLTWPARLEAAGAIRVTDFSAIEPHLSVPHEAHED